MEESMSDRAEQQKALRQNKEKANTTIQGILNSLEKVPPIPSIVLKVLQITRDPDSTHKDLARVIKIDETLTFKVLKMANSAFYNPSGREIATIDEAMIKLGHNALINIVVAEGCSSSFQKAGSGYELQRGELWRHSIACALISQRLANKTGFKDKDVLFTACIIHDIGKTLLDAFSKLRKAELVNLIDNGVIAFTQAEIEVLGFSHPEVGGRILEKWKFPEAIVQAVRHHHDPSKAPDNYKELVYHVYLSDLLCLMMGIGLGLDGLSYECKDEVLELLSLSETDIQLLLVNLIDELEKAEEWIGLTQG
jgi:putative nucleotidyltransferase with HDIG domain